VEKALEKARILVAKMTLNKDVSVGLWRARN
jgi:hypothetical protein